MFEQIDSKMFAVNEYDLEKWRNYFSNERGTNMATISAESILETKRNELNELKKNLDSFSKVIKDLTVKGTEAAEILERLKVDSGMKESDIFTSFNVPNSVQRFVKNTSKEQHESDTTEQQERQYTE
jgi:predicted CopG family antitoxin